MCDGLNSLQDEVDGSDKIISEKRTEMQSHMGPVEKGLVLLLAESAQKSSNSTESL